MSRISIITTLFGIGVIIVAVVLGILFNQEKFIIPDVGTDVLEELSPEINQSFLEDLESRSSNFVGIELEL